MFVWNIYIARSTSVGSNAIIRSAFNGARHWEACTTPALAQNTVAELTSTIFGQDDYVTKIEQSGIGRQGILGAYKENYLCKIRALVFCIDIQVLSVLLQHI